MAASLRVTMSPRYLRPIAAQLPGLNRAYHKRVIRWAVDEKSHLPPTVHDEVSKIFGKYGLKLTFHEISMMHTDHPLYRTMDPSDIKKLTALTSHEIADQRASCKTAKVASAAFAALSFALGYFTGSSLEFFLATAAMAGSYCLSTKSSTNVDVDALEHQMKGLCIGAKHSSIPRKEEAPLDTLYCYLNSPSTAFLKRITNTSPGSELVKVVHLITTKELEELISLTKEALELAKKEDLSIFPSLGATCVISAFTHPEIYNAGMSASLFFSWTTAYMFERRKEQVEFLEALCKDLEKAIQDRMPACV